MIEQVVERCLVNGERNLAVPRRSQRSIHDKRNSRHVRQEQWNVSVFKRTNNVFSNSVGISIAMGIDQQFF